MAIPESQKLANYICIDSKSLEIVLADSPVDSSIAVPCKKDFVISDLFSRLVYIDVLYPLRTARDRRLDPRKRVRYRLSGPDPWLAAIAAVMWEGLIQGLTWDVIKAAVLHALEFLRSKGLAPSGPRDEKQVAKHAVTKMARTQIGFCWTQFSVDGKPLREFFLGLKRVFEEKNEQQRLFYRFRSEEIANKPSKRSNKTGSLPP